MGAHVSRNNENGAAYDRMKAAQPDYLWLFDEPAPKALLIALSLYGTVEIPGPKSTRAILDMAKAVGCQGVYSDDDIPWCGLFAWYCEFMSGWSDQIPPTKNGIGPLWADSWVNFGVKADQPMLGDIMPLGGHVAFYIGEDAANYHVLGGNQSNAVNIRRFAKGRLLRQTARRPAWRVAQPTNVRKIALSVKGIPATSTR